MHWKCQFRRASQLITAPWQALWQFILIQHRFSWGIRETYNIDFKYIIIYTWDDTLYYFDITEYYRSHKQLGFIGLPRLPGLLTSFGYVPLPDAVWCRCRQYRATVPPQRRSLSHAHSQPFHATPPSVQLPAHHRPPTPFCAVICLAVPTAGLVEAIITYRAELYLISAFRGRITITASFLISWRHLSLTPYFDAIASCLRANFYFAIWFRHRYC
jgi:hypothetical protein